MAENETLGTLTITTGRAGTIAEVSGFLNDLEGAYLQLYRFQYMLAEWPVIRRRRKLGLFWEMDFSYPLFGEDTLSPQTILPAHRLVIKRVRIESPGFWEFLASLNPLQQIREYLNDRHKRRQDKEFREAAEQDKLILENELIQRKVWEQENSIFRERVLLMRELGFSDVEIRQFVWATIGRPLTQLGRHQDSRLIDRAE